MKLHLSSASFLLLVSGSCLVCRAILAGEATNSSTNSQQQATTSENKSNGGKLAVSKVNAAQQQATTNTSFDANSTFYYEADTFLLNKSKQTQKLSQGQDEEPPKIHSNITPANHQAISGRNGRMLDLDALLGDLETSRANREARQQLTSRQSRNLNHHHMDIGGGKRLHIQGFIPIVGVKDDQPDLGGESTSSSSSPTMSDQDQLQTSAAMISQALRSPLVQQYNQQRPKMMNANYNELPYGQSSLGHASFNVQRYLNTEQPEQHPVQGSSPNQMQQYQPIDATPKHGNIVDALKKPIKKLTNTFGGSNNNDHQKQLQLQMQQQQQNCLCVPFYMCKNGYISESGLSRSQVQQMILQQQIGQQPRQSLVGGEPSAASMKMAGSVESVPVPVPSQQVQQASYANSFVPVDERSFERDIITAQPTVMPTTTGQPQMMMVMNSLEGASGTNQTLQEGQSESNNKANENDQPELQLNTEQEPTVSSNVANSTSQSSALAPTSPDEMTTLNQSNDYSQEILGRMLGLKANSRVSLLGSVSSAQTGSGGAVQAGGVCGLLRTCCNIPAHLFPLHPQDMQPIPQLSQQQPQQQRVALQRNHQAVMPIPQQQQISRIQTPQYPAASNMQLVYEQPPMSMATGNGLQNSLIHRTSTSVNSGSLMQQQRPMSMMQSSSIQQYARATPAGQQQSLASFQQSPTNYQQITSAVQPIQQPQPMMTRQGGGQMMAPSNALVSQTPRVQQPLGQRKLLEGRCGLRQSAGINGRVQSLQYHENSADFGEYPAQAAILKRLNSSESLFVCSGTLISQSWVATAAHCIRKHMQQGELKVRLGEWDVHRDDEFYPYVEKEVRDLVIHPEFVPGNLINDLALLRLDSALDSSLPHVNPACLPASDESFARQRCWVTGWGKDSFGQRGSFQSVLQEVELPVQGHQECESALRQTRLGPHYRLHPGFICAGGEGGKDACEGDGGSGLYCLHEGVIKVAGLVSWGIGCGQAGVPGVYVSMAQYRAWIENIISIDEDIYSPYGKLPGSLISERQAGSNSTSPFQDQDAGTSSNSTVDSSG